VVILVIMNVDIAITELKAEPSVSVHSDRPAPSVGAD
jgi:hypothetical protein